MAQNEVVLGFFCFFGFAHYGYAFVARLFPMNPLATEIPADVCYEHAGARQATPSGRCCRPLNPGLTRKNRVASRPQPVHSHLRKLVIISPDTPA